ncbi:Protein of unknown function (DUF4005) [Carpediemonas membranifera]|uniref:Uncharacterized protein n=1 Tax=Carpediemonas membranifera TaxID=201153 RepID=A0A8J6AXX8_9EUKA|nr:Protein of unknown function (DUF4005) [Carpediemonas membranifera]|eukprot:KAG9397576.1 Protein of unknown function (DUF4005) [Carpediemonas membranifera]
MSASTPALTSPERPFKPDHWAANLRSGHSELRSSSIGLLEPMPRENGKMNDETTLERRERFLNILSVIKTEESDPDFLQVDDDDREPTGPKTWKEYARALRGDAKEPSEDHTEGKSPASDLPLFSEDHPCLDMQYYLDDEKTEEVYLAVRDAVLSNLPTHLLPVYQALRPAATAPPALPSFMQQTQSAAAKVRPVGAPTKAKKKVPAKIDTRAAYLQPTVASLTRTETTVHENLHRNAKLAKLKEMTPVHSQRGSEAELPRPTSTAASRPADITAQWASMFAGMPPPPPVLVGPDATPHDMRLATMKRKFFEQRMRDFAEHLLGEMGRLTLDNDPHQAM